MSNMPTAPLSLESLQDVSPALARYTRSTLLGDVWTRPGLPARDRSLITLAALISRNQSIEMQYHLNLALDNGVKPAEISEVLAQLAFYCGWPNALSAASVAKDVFAKRGIDAKQLPAASVELLPLDEAAEAQRVAAVEQLVGSSVPGIVHYMTEVLFHDLWLRPSLAPRDRSLVTLSGLIAAGQVAQVTFHLNKAMDNGLTQGQAAEVITHLAFYVGWPNAMSAVPIARAVFEKRLAHRKSPSHQAT